jgi:NDP-sugar pyrophosphorylase family protein
MRFLIHAWAFSARIPAMLIASDLFEFPESLPFAEIFQAGLAPWEWVPRIKEALKSLDASRFHYPWETPSGCLVEGEVYIHPSVKLPPFCSIRGPVYIAEGCEIRPGAYIRGNVIAGRNCVLGNSSEFKNCLLLDGVQVPHFSYVGDSILGNRAHLGAGVICSNLRLDQANVPVHLPDGSRVDSGLRKLGALLGDDAEAGCNAVLNPGSILGKRSLVMPGMSFRGTLEANTMAFEKSEVRTVSRGD